MLVDCASRIPWRFGFAEAARRRLSDKIRQTKLLGKRNGLAREGLDKASRAVLPAGLRPT
jgi:hypothetical protein